MMPRKLCDQKARDKPGALAVALEREAAAKPVQEKDEDGKDKGLWGFGVLGFGLRDQGSKFMDLGALGLRFGNQGWGSTVGSENYRSGLLGALGEQRRGPLIKDMQWEPEFDKLLYMHCFEVGSFGSGTIE